MIIRPLQDSIRLNFQSRSLYTVYEGLHGPADSKSLTDTYLSRLE